ncbi:MAG: 5-dehydro-4-deoxy-D-glucuronate isomerase [Sedimentisphaerales bacterium]|nr:5-dehydro-4-deoxy-D-glucuronate isomerase [Sedimentisphaerales bacterium]
MEMRISSDPERFKRMTTDEIRSTFLVDNLFEPGVLKLIYSDVDRMILGSAVPVNGEKIKLDTPKELLCEFFTDRRELGVINIGPSGNVSVDNDEFNLDAKDVLYLGKGSRNIIFSSNDPSDPALFYLASYPAHAEYPTRLLKNADAVVLDYGSEAQANKRKINCYFTEQGLQSCQLCIGITDLAQGSVWNTMPAHLHPTRSEAYLYFNMDEDNVLFHIMGQPHETRHITVKNQQAVLSPSWSIHSGVATKSYSFLWAMGGEDKETLVIDKVNGFDIR